MVTGFVSGAAQTASVRDPMQLEFYAAAFERDPAGEPATTRRLRDVVAALPQGAVAPTIAIITMI